VKFFLVAFIFLLSLGQLQRLQLNTNLAFYLHDLLVFGFLSWQLFAAIVQRKKIIEKWKKIPKNSKKIFYLLVLSCFSAWLLAFSQNRFDWRALLYVGRLLAYLAFVFLLQKKLAWANWPWRLISFNLLVLGFLQYFFLPDLRFLVHAGFDDHFYRMSSTILDPSFLGLIFVFNLNFYLWQKQKNWLMISLFALGLLLTYARAAYLALLFSTLFYLFTDQDANKKALLVFLAVFIASWPFLPRHSGGDGVDLLRRQSVQLRLSGDAQILQSMRGADWLIGRGLYIPSRNLELERGRTPIHAHFADNLVVFLLTNLGLLGSGLLLILLWQTLALANREQWVLLSSLLVHAMFNHNLSQSFVWLIFLGFWWSRKTIKS